MEMFSQDVELDIRNHGDIKTADFIKLVRNWFLACDERGIGLRYRLEALLDMHEYMMRLYDPSIYPPPASHVYGLSVQTFEVLLQSISTRI